MADIKTATTLTYVAAILQVVFTAIAILAIIFGTGGTNSLPIFFGAIGVIGIIAALIWSYVDYYIVYKGMKAGRHKQTSTTMLVVGILQLFLGGTIPGILILIAWFLARS